MPRTILPILQNYKILKVWTIYIGKKYAKIFEKLHYSPRHVIPTQAHPRL